MDSSPDSASPQRGACDHTQPAEVARLGEEFLRAKGVPEEAWSGCRFGFGGSGGSGPFKSVYTEVERRGPQWVAVKLDRLRTDLPPDRSGFRVAALSEAARAIIDR